MDSTRQRSQNEGDFSCDEDAYADQDEIELDAEVDEMENVGQISSGKHINPEMHNAPVNVAGSGLPWILELCLRNLGCQSVGSGSTSKCTKLFSLLDLCCS